LSSYACALDAGAPRCLRGCRSAAPISAEVISSERGEHERLAEFFRQSVDDAMMRAMALRETLLLSASDLSP